MLGAGRVGSDEAATTQARAEINRGLRTGGTYISSSVFPSCQLWCPIARLKPSMIRVRDAAAVRSIAHDN
jgi:hypothetical protein